MRTLFARSLRALTALSVVATTAVGATSAPPAGATPTGVSFNDPTKPGLFIVPAGVPVVHVHAVGGSGADGTDLVSPSATHHGGHGGLGGTVDADIAVHAGDVLVVNVGGQGTSSPTGAPNSGLGGAAGHPDWDPYQRQSGGGGSVTIVRRNGVELVAAGGGGGGGSASPNSFRQGDGGDGGNGGGARGYYGHGAGAGAGGNGVSGNQNGGDGGDAATYSYAGGGGGGGGGWRPGGFGGGAGGNAGYSGAVLGGAGGGGAGGRSYSIDPAYATSVASSAGDGMVSITYDYFYATDGTLTGATSVTVGTPTQMTATLGWAGNAYYPTGWLTFGRVDATNGQEVDLEYWDVAQAVVHTINPTFTSYPTVWPVGSQRLYAAYTGDAHHAPWKQYLDLTVVAPTPGITATPATIAFGQQAVSSTTKQTITLKNSGTVAWSISSLSFSGVGFSLAAGGTCSAAALAPQQTCTLVAAFSPYGFGAESSVLTVGTDAGVSATVALTGKGLAPPTVTALTPATGEIAGGTLVVLTGTNFVRLSAITFGGVAGAGVVCPTTTQCNVVAPAHAAGSVHVRVTTPAGTSATNTVDRYTYQ